MRQAAMFMLKNLYKYYKPLEIELLRTGESYESYCFNVYNRNIWGNDLITAVIGNMWNIAISIVTPLHKKPVALFHNKDIPDMVLVANGSDYMSQNGSTHFSTTRCYDTGHKIVGSEYLNLTVAQDLTGKMTPIILDDHEKAKQEACRNFIKIDEERSIGLLQGLCDNINRLDDKICELIQESDKVRKQKNIMEFQMEKIGINCDKIKRATQILKGDRGYVRTGEREKFDDKQEKKAEEELREQEEKWLKTITLGEEPKEKEKEKSVEEGYESKLTRQQQEIIRQQEILLQKQEQHIEEQEKHIRMMEEKQLQPQPEQPRKERHTSILKASTSGRAGTIDKFLKPSALSFLTKCVKKEPKEEQEDDNGDDEEDEVIVTGVTQKTETVKYIPKSVAGLENLVLVPLTKTKGSSKRSSKGPLVPKGRQDPKRFYCDQCECNYNRPDELTHHKRKKEPEFFCEECSKGFFHKNGVREHFYHQHTDLFLWYCTKCGEGFHFKSNKSKHKTACPNPNGPDKFEGRIP